MNKIQALEKTIYNLENDVYEYNWSNEDSCNCGILARTLLGGKLPSNCGFLDTPSHPMGQGIFAKEAYCLKTDLPLPEVFKALKNAGFTYEELLELEYLGNEKIATRLNMRIEKSVGVPFMVSPDPFNSNLYHTEKEFLISYLKEWIKMLKEEQGVPPPIPAITFPDFSPITYEKITELIPQQSNS